MSQVGSLGTSVAGSSEGKSAMLLCSAETNPWLQMIVRSTTSGSTTTSKVTVAAVVGPEEGSAGIDPGAGLAGVRIGMPFASGESPLRSASGEPLSVVL